MAKTRLIVLLCKDNELNEEMLDFCLRVKDLGIASRMTLSFKIVILCSAMWFQIVIIKFLLMLMYIYKGVHMGGGVWQILGLILLYGSTIQSCACSHFTIPKPPLPTLKIVSTPLT